MGERGGMILETGDAFRFVPADVAATVVPSATVVPVPGLVPPAVGVVLTDDRVATVLQVGTGLSDHMVLCEIDGGSVALSGARVAAVGVFPRSRMVAGVVWQGHTAETLDVAALAREVEASIWRASSSNQDERRG